MEFATQIIKSTLTTDTYWVTLFMIQTFRHKGIAHFFRTGNTRGIQATHANRLRLILTVLNQATHIKDLKLPGLRLHTLRGDRKGYWSVSISGNWRIIFRFSDGAVYDVELIDYH